jgi:hypothetical protein
VIAAASLIATTTFMSAERENDGFMNVQPWLERSAPADPMPPRNTFLGRERAVLPGVGRHYVYDETEGESAFG